MTIHKTNKLVREYLEAFRDANKHLHDLPELTYEDGKYRVIWRSLDNTYSAAKLKQLIGCLKARSRVNVGK